MRFSSKITEYHYPLLMVPQHFAASSELSPFYRRCINSFNNVHIPCDSYT